jgi:dUTP pyrophosphatase
MDLRAAEDVLIPPGKRAMVGTGIKMAIPSGYEGQVRPRSGLAAKHGVTLLNSPGTVDSDYRGEVRVIMINLGEEIFEVKRGDRIAQIVFAPCVRLETAEAASLPETARDGGGFGSTGVK